VVTHTQAVFTAGLWAAEPLYNATDSVASLTSAGDELITELFDEVGRSATA
jgi:putative SOS response-associated peptidase YedK